MHSLFQRLVDELLGSPDVSSIGDTLAEALSVLDIQSYAYLLIPAGQQNETRLISNYPSAWTTRYLAERYETTDPVIVKAQRTSNSFAWGSGADLHLLSASHAKFFEDAAGFGIRCGYTIPIRDGRAHFAALTLAANSRKPKFDRAIERYDPTLQLIAALFHRAARRSLVSDRTVGGVALSPREYEALSWAAKGKTAWEIGVILGISQRTAVYHLEHAKQKLGVFSIAEAIARFISAASEL